MSIEQQMIEKVQTWAKARGLYDKGSVQTQTLKLVEEFGELEQAILDNNIDEIVDAVGDIQVVMINLVTLDEGDYLEELLQCRFVEAKSRVDTIISLGLLCEAVLKPNKAISIKDVLTDLISIAKQVIVTRNYTLSYCLEKAYEQIANRKGEMVNGNFVKAED